MGRYGSDGWRDLMMKFVSEAQEKFMNKQW